MTDRAFQAIDKYDEDLGGYSRPNNATLPVMHKTDAYLRQVFKELPASRSVQQ